MAQQSKILYLVTQSEWGGAQRYIFDLANHLKSNGYETAVAAGGNQELHTKLDENKIKSYRLKNLVREIRPIKDLEAYFEIKKLLRQIQPDILHLNSSKAGVIGAIAGKHAGVKKIIYTVHGFVFNEPMSVWKKALYLWLEKFSAKYKHKLICVSNFDKQSGLDNKIAPEEKLITINNGLGQLDFLNSQIAKERLGLPDGIIVGTVANFYLTKGLNYLIQAAKIVTKKKPGVIFAIIGDGEQRKMLESEIKELNLQNNFILLGQKEKAWQYLPAFDIYVCSSVKEGFPFTILEAMEADLPIVTTNVGGIPEIISDQNGLLVKPADPKALAEALISLLENKNLAKQLASQAKIDVEQKFSLKKMVEETKKVYWQ